MMADQLQDDAPVVMQRRTDLFAFTDTVQVRAAFPVRCVVVEFSHDFNARGQTLVQKYFAKYRSFHGLPGVKGPQNKTNLQMFGSVTIFFLNCT